MALDAHLALNMRLAVVATHPIQYYAPWFRHLASRPEIELHVFYLWDFGTQQRFDPGFGRTLVWDLPLLEGYEHEFVRNRSLYPGTDRFSGLVNPGLAAQIQRFSPDAVLMMSYSHWSTLGYVLWSRLPLLFRGDSHFLAGVPRSRSWRHRLKDRLFARFRAVLFVGKANREFWRCHKVSDDRLFFSPHAVDNRRFVDALPQAALQAAEIRQVLDLGDAAVAMFVGKLDSQKRPLELLRAFLDRAPLNSVLVFVGTGALEAALREVAAGNSRVHFFGFRNQAEMPAMYALADVIVLPSRGETWGLAINEAMASGRTAIVSSHVGCHPDLIEQGVTGWVFPAGDDAALGEALADALSDRDRLRRMGVAASKRVAEYSYEAATAGLLEALHQIAPRK